MNRDLIAIHLYYSLRGINRRFAAWLANAIASPNHRFGGTIEDLAKDIERIRAEHPDWPLWHETQMPCADYDRDELVGHVTYDVEDAGHFLDDYGVSWG